MTENTSVAGSRDVVVGVDGSLASVAALRYARTEADRTGGELRVVHVLPDYAAAGYPMPAQELTEGGRAVLRTALQLAGTDRGATVHSVLLHGARAAALTAYARTSRVLVVGADRRSITARLLTGNTSTGVAASSAAPVVAVPETWLPTGSDVVLVAVKTLATATEVLGEAFALAQARGSRLLVLHAWRFPMEYDGAEPSPVVVAEWSQRLSGELAAAASGWRAAYPDLAVELRVVHDQAAHALVVASGEVDELVLVRRAHGFPTGVHLGSTARTVLRASACPVRVLPPGHTTVVPPPALVDVTS